MLLAIGLILTLAPVVYVALERAEMLKVAAVLVLLARRRVRRDLRRRVGGRAEDRDRRERARPSSGSRCCSARWRSPAPVAGRTWCRATGSGTRASAWAGTCRGSRARSPASRRPRRAPASSSSRPTSTWARWRAWWRFANREQLYTFVLITFLTILFTSLLAYSTVYGRDDLANDIGFLQIEGDVAEARRSAAGSARSSGSSARSRCSPRRSASWTTRPRWSRTSSRPPTPAQAKESTLYFAVVWALVLIGCVIMLVGLRAAAGAAGDLGVRRRRDDVHLLDPAAGAQPQGAAGRRSRSAAAASPCWLVGRPVRRAERADDHRPGASSSSAATRPRWTVRRRLPGRRRARPGRARRRARPRPAVRARRTASRPATRA